MAEKIFSSALSYAETGITAVEEVSAKVTEDLNGRPCHLAVLFFSEPYSITARLLLQEFRERAHPGVLIACNSSGVIGDDREIELQPALSVLAMHLPQISIDPFIYSPVEIEAFSDATELVADLDLYPTDSPKFICLADPMTCDAVKLLELFNQGYPEIPVIGGLASGNVAGAKNWVALNDEVYEEGAVGVVLGKGVTFDVCVSQGCRPIGMPLAVTRAEKNLLLELSGKSPMEAFKEIYRGLSENERMLAQNSLFVGIAIDELRTEYKRGDFLIRNILGVDRGTGGMSVGTMLEPGQTVQFHLRDAKASDEDLKAMLEKMEAPGDHLARGGLLVNCCGRGRGLYGEENHDIRTIQKFQGPLSLAGFFANGEFGPVRQRNYIHGYTSSLTVIS